MGTPTVLYGQAGTGAWEANARPETWRPGIQSFDVNGDLPLVAMTERLKKVKVTDGFKMHWAVEGSYFQTRTATEIYLEPTLTTAVTGTTTAAGLTVYVKAAQADVEMVRPRHVVRLTYNGVPRYQKVGVVTARVLNGASSYFAVTLTETDAAVGAASLASANRFRVIGNVNEQGAPSPVTFVTQPYWFENVCQIFRTSLRLTRTELRTTTRYGTPEYQRRKAQKFLDHKHEIEETILFGRYAPDLTGDDGMPMPMTKGLFQFYAEEAPTDNIRSYTADESGKTWIEGGEDWFADVIEHIYAKGPRKRLVICGNGVLNGISRMVRAGSLATLEAGRTSWGWDITNLKHHMGDLQFLTHPLFNTDDDLSHTALICVPESLEWCELDPTFFRASKAVDKEAGEIGVDGILEEWCTEAGLTLGVPEFGGILYDVGVDG